MPSHANRRLQARAHGQYVGLLYAQQFMQQSRRYNTAQLQDMARQVARLRCVRSILTRRFAHQSFPLLK